MTECRLHVEEYPKYFTDIQNHNGYQYFEIVIIDVGYSPGFDLRGY